MSKKIIAILLNIFLCAELCQAAESKFETINGINQLEKKMNIEFINKLQATADNDGISFSANWPNEYFETNKKQAYLYIAQNGINTLELIMFNINRNNENCFTGENPSFCIPEISPEIEKYSYQNRLTKEWIPNFIDNENNIAKSEILTKDGKYFDTKNITLLKQPTPDNIYKSCTYDNDGFVEECKTYTKRHDELKYIEKLDRKPNISNNHIYHYIKTTPEGNKIEEYYYSSGKHIKYSQNGKIEKFCQLNNDKFKFYDKNIPDLYLETYFIRDENGNVTEERIYDRNHRLVRNYNATYKDDETISTIAVNDFINNAKWTIRPIGIDDIVYIPFRIRM